MLFDIFVGFDAYGALLCKFLGPGQFGILKTFDHLPAYAEDPGREPGNERVRPSSRSGSFGGVGLDGPSVAQSAKESEFPLKKLKIPRA